MYYGGAPWWSTSVILSYYVIRANTYGTSEGSYFADGSIYSPDKAGSVWENVETYVPWIEKVLNWLISLFSSLGESKRKDINADNTNIKQTEFMTEIPGGNSKTSFSSLGIGLMALAGGMLLFGGKRKKKE